MTYEQYIEAIEQVSREEEARGATTGGEYARNRTFNFAQKSLEAAQSQTHELSLMDAKKQYEIERRKSEQSMNAVVLQHIANIETIAQQRDTEIRGTAQKQKEELILNQDAIVEQTKTDIDHIISKELQIEKSRMEREIYELEDVRPAREAARAAIKLVEDREKELRTHKRLKSGLALLGVAVFIALIVILTFFPSLKAIAVILLLVFGLIIITVALRKSGITEGKIAKDKLEIASFKTKSGDYAPLSEEDQCALLTQSNILII